MARRKRDDGMYFCLYGYKTEETYKLRFFENDVIDDTQTECWPTRFLGELLELLITSQCASDSKGPGGATRWLFGSITELKLLEKWAHEYTCSIDPDDGQTIYSVRLERV